MKKFIIISLLIFFTGVTSVHALSWAYVFVVWDGKVYEVTDEEIDASLIGNKIGSVRTVPNDMTGHYYGNASNHYPKGTNYFQINNIPVDEAIAVQAEDKMWVKAVYAQEASFHPFNVVGKILPFVAVIGVVILLVITFRKGKTKPQT